MADLSRRAFLKLTAGGGAAAAAGLGAKSATKLIPYVIPPDDVRPGVANWYASLCRECPAGCGVHARHRDGRVVKVEGNPGHPVNVGGLCARGQSAVQGQYDPDRLAHPIRRLPDGKTVQTQWDGVLQDVGKLLRGPNRRISLVMDLQTGAMAEVAEAWVKAFGSDRLLMVEPFNHQALTAAHRAVFGVPAIPDYRLDQCDFILSFAADFLETWISPVAFARQFAEMHRLRNGRMGRLAYVGPRLSMTAANADHVVSVPAGAQRWVALGMLHAMVNQGLAREDADRIKPLVAPFDPDSVAKATGVAPDEIVKLAQAFANAKASVALAGPTGAVGSVAIDTAIAAALLNHAAGRVGQTVDFSRPHALGRTASQQDVRTLLSGLGKKDTLVLLNVNPAYTAGAAEQLAKAGAVICLTTQGNETSAAAQWVLPIDTPLESWGDYEPTPDVHGLMQPTMKRLHNSRAAGDVLLDLAAAAGKRLSRDGKPMPTFQDWLEARWEGLHQRLAPERPFEQFWEESLRAGFVAKKPKPVPVKLTDDLDAIKLSPPKAAAGLALWAWPSVNLFDGRASNRGWLQEVGDPTTQIVWRNWVDLNPATAKQLGVRNDDVVALSVGAKRIEAPVRVTEDVVANTAAIAFGQGHGGRGANVFDLLGGDPADQVFASVTVKKTGKRLELVSTAATQEQHHREIIQWVALDQLRRMKPGDGEKLRLPLAEGYDPKHDVYEPHKYKNHRWAMAVDLQRCNGCGACAVACYAENNISVTGEERLRKGREMAWLQVAPYRDDHDPSRMGFLPVMCQHCDAAPCEPVCPVFAAVHNEEGLNAQVYNRCIGTRYCANNCPYKVRRFNWFDPEWPEPTHLQLNPDVSVRVRGVMEKCTFCVQRIKDATLRAKREGRDVRDGEIQTACAQSCPTRAIVFGDLLDKESAVSKLARKEPRRYQLLGELNTKPAVTYLRRIRQDS
jgi:anaerobic selenocysteine-containing dehydrogenase/Fe-S-cluster-containing dehydrogenase component